MKKHLLNTLWIMLAGLIPASISAQNRWIDPEYVIEGHPFVMSRNPSGLFWMSPQNISCIQADMNNSHGGLVNYYESDNLWKTGITANSIFHFNDRIVLRGGIGYTYRNGDDCSGSVFLHPDQNALDITEFTDENKGRTLLEQYHLLAETSWRVWKGLVLGGSFDFTSANYAKMKDLRHLNTYSDIRLDLSSAYRFNEKISLGASYHHIKRIESIYFRRYSPAERRHEMLLSYGSFWGKRKTYDDRVGIISSNTLPLYDRFNGGSLQLEVDPTHRSSFFLEGEILFRNGSLGLKSPTTTMYNSFDGLEYGVSLKSIFRESRNRHLITLEMHHDQSDTEESVFQPQTTENGSSYLEYYDPIHVGSGHTNTFRLDYRADLHISEDLPAFTIRWENQLHQQFKQGIQYPYYQKHTLWHFDSMVSFMANIPYRKNMLGAGLAAGYTDGLKEMMEEGSYLPDPTQLRPNESEFMRGREKEYLMNAQMAIHQIFRYTRQFKKLSAYAEIDYAYRHSLDAVSFLSGNHRHIFHLSVGIVL